VARSATAVTLSEHTADISVVDFLARRRPVPHLFDLAPQMDPAAFAEESGYAAGAPVYGLVRTEGERQTDVRLLVDDGEAHLGLAIALAENLRCDVYLTPQDSYVRYVRQSSPVAGDSWEAIVTDRATGEPATWLVMRPPDLPSDVPTWFTSVRGRLRPSHGVVAVTLPDGIAFATKSTFRDTTYLAATMRTSTNRVSTVAVNSDMGRFEINRFDGAASLLGGVEFATLVGASLDMIHPDVQLALTWPADAAACTALDAELIRFADALNRTVWVPRPQGAAFVLPGCGEFAAVDEVGSPSVWHPYPSRLAPPQRPLYNSDLDGRLVPVGGTRATAFAGVRFVSVPAPQLERLRSWYESVAPLDELFGVDFSVLADGRLGLLIEDGTPIAVGPRELREHLRHAGWSGEDLLLLTQPPARYWDAAMQHVQSLANQLMVDIWFAALGADVWAQEDGTLAASAHDGSDIAWRVATFGRSRGGLGGAPAEHISVPAALTTAPPSAVGRRLAPHPGAGMSDPGRRAALGAMTAAVTAAPAPPTGAAQAAPDLSAIAEPTIAQPTIGQPAVVEPVAVTPPRALGQAGPHGVAWLPATPVVNRRAIDLYLWTPRTEDHVEAWGLPSADLFLLAGQDPLRISDRRRNGYLLRVAAPKETAIELFEHESQAPAVVRQRLLESGSTHLLPLAWVSDLRVTARFDLDGGGGVAARTDVDGGALAIRFEGADHGVPGLPNDVVHWPDKGQRAGVPSYLMLRDDTPLDQVIHRGYVSLSRRKPQLLAGHTLIEVKVRKRKAIDVPATLDTLGGLPVVGRLHDFVGLDLLLPEADLGHAAVSRIWRQGPTGKPIVDRPVGEILSETLTAGVIEHRTGEPGALANAAA
jgi:hypothetical protein